MAVVAVAQQVNRCWIFEGQLGAKVRLPYNAVACFVVNLPRSTKGVARNSMVKENDVMSAAKCCKNIVVASSFIDCEFVVSFVSKNCSIGDLGVTVFEDLMSAF